MPYHTDLSNQFTIDDKADLSNLTGASGLVPRDYDVCPIGDGGYAQPFNVPLIPRSEWRDRIEELDKRRMGIQHLMKHHGLTPKNQGRTNFCWANGVVHASEIGRILTGVSGPRLSSASVACLVTNFRNVGGWGYQALKIMRELGAVPQQLWPANAIDRRYHNAETQAARAAHKVHDWLDMQPRNFDQLMTCLLMGWPCSVAYNWWRHLVTAVHPVVDRNGQFGILCSNSGLGRDRDGWTVLMGSRAVADEQICLRITSA
jgi:hypothetical protein